jgi:hypothetical protein
MNEHDNALLTIASTQNPFAISIPADLERNAGINRATLDNSSGTAKTHPITEGNLARCLKF